jgi:hypothetical protein
MLETGCENQVPRFLSSRVFCLQHFLSRARNRCVRAAANVLGWHLRVAEHCKIPVEKLFATEEDDNESSPRPSTLSVEEFRDFLFALLDDPKMEPYFEEVTAILEDNAASMLPSSRQCIQMTARLLSQTCRTNGEEGGLQFSSKLAEAIFISQKKLHVLFDVESLRFFFPWCVCWDYGNEDS